MTESIFEEIEIAKKTLVGLRPLSGGALRALEEWYDVNFTYTSNAIEGNTLTRNETAIVIEKGITVRGKPLKDHNEAIDHYQAVKFMRALASEVRAIGETDIKQLHQLTVATTLASAGQYATRGRFVVTSDGRYAFPPPQDVPQLMQAFAATLPAVATPQDAFRAHLDLVVIHPFDDGNGRTARLLMNALLLRLGYLPVMVGPPERPDYIDAIEVFQKAGDASPFLAFMGAQLLTVIEDHVVRVGGR